MIRRTVIAKFPIQTAPEKLGVVPTTGVRASIDVRTGETGIGADILNVIGATSRIQQRTAKQEEAQRLREQRIREKRQQMSDANNSVLATKVRKQKDTEFATFKLTNPQETWEKFRAEQTEQAAGEVDALPFSDDARERERFKSVSYTDVETAQALTDATRQLRTDTIDAQTEALTEAFRTGSPEEIAESTRRYIDNGANMGKDKVEVLNDIKTAREAGEKLRKQDILDDWRDRIAVDPAATEEVLEAELEARKTGKGVISELDSGDIQSLLNTATNRQSQLTADAEKEINAKNTALETKLHDDIVAGDASITDIQSSGLPASNKRRLEQDINDRNKRDIEKTWALQDSKVASQGANSVLIDIEAGQIDINEARNKLSEFARQKTPDGRSIMAKTTFDETMDKIAKGGRDAVDLFTDEQTAIVSNSLTARLTEREARLRIRSEARTLTATEKRQFSTTGFLLQVAKHQEILYNNGLAQRLRTLGIEDTSGKEAKAEAVKIWESIKRKDLTQRINDFLSASGQELVKPFGFPAETWEKSDARNRTAIVQAVSEGFTNKEIEELLIK